MSDWSVESLFRAYALEIRRFLSRRVSCAEVAADLTQDTFLQFLRAEPDDRVANPRAYLFRTASNLAVDRQREEARRPPLATDPELLAQTADPLPSPEARLLTREELDLLRKAIAALPPRCREVFLLQRFGGLSYEAIAQRLGISKNTVMVQMYKAMTALRRHIDLHRKEGR